jgi:transcription factor C subunit 7
VRNLHHQLIDFYREWYGTARFTHPSAAELSLLQTMFPALEENTTITPSSNGETIEELHDRCAFALDSIISDGILPSI